VIFSFQPPLIALTWVRTGASSFELRHRLRHIDRRGRGDIVRTRLSAPDLAKSRSIVVGIYSTIVSLGIISGPVLLEFTGTWARRSNPAMLL
jgi:hypothetical protein